MNRQFRTDAPARFPGDRDDRARDGRPHGGLPAHWYELLLHNRTASRVELDRWPLRVVVVASVPYHLRQHGDGAGWAIESMTTGAEQQWTRRDSAAFW